MLKKIKSIFPIKFKTFVKKFRNFNSYNNLDKQMLEYINYKNGFYVDIGANDGVNQSTTWYFEKKLKWRGILIEPLPHVYKELIQNRSDKNYFFNCAAVSKDYKKKKIELSFNNDSLTAKIKSLEIDDKNKQTIKVKALTIKEIFNKTKPNTKFIDFFSLDVEGAELEVLNGIDFKKNIIKFFLIETSNFKQLNSFMSKKKFKFVKRLSNYNLKNLPDYGDYLFKNSKI